MQAFPHTIRKFPECQEICMPEQGKSFISIKTFCF